MVTTTSPVDGIIEKIQKLLAMTTENGCTESEAANAALLASKLLVQHKLEMSDVLKASFAKGEVEAVSGSGKVKDNVSTAWAIGIAKRVAKLSFCQVFGVPSGFEFVGFADDVQVATALMDHFMLYGAAVMNQARDMDWATFKKAKPGVRYQGIKFRGEFLTGFGMSVSTRLESEILIREAALRTEKAEAARIAEESKAAGMPNPSAGGYEGHSTTTLAQVAEYSEVAIRKWVAAQKSQGQGFKTSRRTSRIGAATVAGIKAGESAPLSPQSAIA